MPAPLVLGAVKADEADRGKGTFENDLDLLTIGVSTCNTRTAVTSILEFCKNQFLLSRYFRAGPERRNQSTETCFKMKALHFLEV